MGHSGAKRKSPIKKEAKSTSRRRVPHHPKNPYKPDSLGYGLLVDLIAQSGQKGISKESLLKSYCRINGKTERNARFDLAVINSASPEAKKRHRSCKDGFTVIKTNDHYRIRFP